MQEEILEQLLANLKTPKSYKSKVNEFGLVDNSQFAMNLRLKKGIRVMIISNIDIKDSLVNGSLGMVLDIVKEKDQVVKGDAKKMIQTLLTVGAFRLKNSHFYLI